MGALGGILRMTKNVISSSENPIPIIIKGNSG